LTTNSVHRDIALRTFSYSRTSISNLPPSRFPRRQFCSSRFRYAYFTNSHLWPSCPASKLEEVDPKTKERFDRPRWKSKFGAPWAISKSIDHEKKSHPSSGTTFLYTLYCTMAYPMGHSAFNTRTLWSSGIIILSQSLAVTRLTS
jgi:hypothetical protein